MVRIKPKTYPLEIRKRLRGLVAMDEELSRTVTEITAALRR